MPESQKVPATCLWHYILIYDAFNYLFAQWMHYLSWNYHATPVYTNYPCVYQLPLCIPTTPVYTNYPCVYQLPLCIPTSI